VDEANGVKGGDRWGQVLMCTCRWEELVVIGCIVGYGDPVLRACVMVGWTWPLVIAAVFFFVLLGCGRCVFNQSRQWEHAPSVPRAAAS